eukprot:scaffold1853_cov185-Amphora_coffeaeformis.AAC.4
MEQRPNQQRSNRTTAPGATRRKRGARNDESRRTSAPLQGAASMGVQPTENDIILGRGVLHVEKTGNRRYYELLDAYMPLYEAANTKGGKTRIVRTIYQELESRGARFLRKTKKTGIYIDIEPKHAKKKISHAIRYRRRSSQDDEDDDEDHQDEHQDDSNNEIEQEVEHDDGRYSSGRRQQPRLNVPDSLPSNGQQVPLPPSQVASTEGVPSNAIPENITFQQQQENFGDYNDAALNSYQTAQYLEYLASDSIYTNIPPVQPPTSYSLQQASSPPTSSSFGQTSFLPHGFATFLDGGGGGTTLSSTAAVDPSRQGESDHSGNSDRAVGFASTSFSPPNNNDNGRNVSMYGMTDNSVPWTLSQQQLLLQQQRQLQQQQEQQGMHQTPTNVGNQQRSNSKSPSREHQYDSSKSSTTSSGLFPSDDLEQVLGGMGEDQPFYPI